VNISQEYIANAMQPLELSEQVVILEGVVAEFGIEQSADIIVHPLLSVDIDLDGGQYPAELVERVKRLKDQVRMFNQGRFGTQ
jgi:hypothetical protein